MLAVVGLFALFTINKWWWGVFLFMVVGFTQDPVRKIIPEQPPYFVVLVAVVFLAAVIGLFLRNYKFTPSSIPGWNRGVAQAISALCAVIIFQIVNAYYNFQSMTMVGLGALTYLAPISAIFLGYYFACYAREKGILNAFKIYSLFALISTSGIYLEYYGIESELLGEIGVGLTIYDLDTILNPYSGLFRSTELAAWHIFFGSCLMMIFALQSRAVIIRALWLAGVVFLISAGILTGRRKLVMTVLIFISCYWMLLLVLNKRSFRTVISVFIISVAVMWIGVSSGIINDTKKSEFDLYVERASSVFGDVTSRVDSLGIPALLSAIERFGLLGKGAGAFSQGAKYGGNTGRTVFEVESGFGRIVAEIGLFGFLVILWLIIVMIINVWRILLYLAFKADSFSSICYGFVSILVANCAHFVVAAQVFSDPFILILLGFLLGIITAAPMLVMLNQRESIKIKAFNSKGVTQPGYVLS